MLQNACLLQPLTTECIQKILVNSIKQTPKLMNQRFLFMTMLYFLCINISTAQTGIKDTAVTISVAVDNQFICPDKKEVYQYIDLAASQASKRIPLNIAIVLDRSGSMESEERLHNAKIAINYLIDHLTEDDICSIIIYDHVAEIIHGASKVTDKEYLKKKINHIQPGGHTNIGQGLQLGYQEAKLGYSPDKLNRVILLSDGVANEGITDDYLLEMMVREHSRRDNISTSTFGMGHEFNEILMHNIAEEGGGNYYFIERAQDAINDFTSEIKLLEGIVAKNGTLKIEFPSSNLSVNQVFGFPYTINKDKILIDLKEIHPQETHAVLVKYNITTPPIDSLRITTTLQYLNIMSSISINKSSTIAIKMSDNSQDCDNGLNRDVFDKIVFFSSNYYLDSAMKHAEKGDYDKAHETIKSAKKMHETNVSKNKSIASDKQYQLISEYEGELKKNSAHPQKINLLHKRIRHKNYKLRKMTNKCP